MAKHSFAREHDISPDTPGGYLRQARHQRGLSIREQADELGLNSKLITNYELNYFPIPPKRFHELAIGYHVSLEELAIRMARFDQYAGRQRQREETTRAAGLRDEALYWRSRYLALSNMYDSLTTRFALLSGLYEALREELEELRGQSPYRSSLRAGGPSRRP